VRIAFAIPGDLTLPTGGYTYDRRVLAEWGHMGLSADVIGLPGSFPLPSPEDLSITARRLAAVPPDVPLLVDGLALGAFDATTLDAIRAPLVALVHHPLHREAGTPPDRAAALKASETLALHRAAAVIVTSVTTAQVVAADFGIAPTHIHVAEPGVDEAPRAMGTGSPLQLLAVGAVVPRKALPLLVEAFAMADLADARLDIVGALDRSPTEVAVLRQAISDHQLEGGVRLRGALDDAALAEAYARADLFVLASLYEGYGMVLTEALARGLPIITTDAVAAPLPADAARIVPAGDAQALADALRMLGSDHVSRQHMADAAWQAASGLPRWQQTGARIARVLAAIGATSAGRRHPS
jgi:glycosyltransferase involved in cell wall biosynthesis